MAPDPHPVRCTALTRQSLPCRRWACRPERAPAIEQKDGESEGARVPLCAVHASQAATGALRCAALTATGERCRNLALAATRAGGRVALCAVHARANRPARDDPRRCSARRHDGQRCGRWALRGSKPPLCSAHRRWLARPADTAERCRALTKTGTPCRRWATRASRQAGEPRCSTHGGAFCTVSLRKDRCRALTNSGKRCRRWATHASRQAARPRCWAHEGTSRPLPPETDRCRALTASRRRCRNWAMRDRRHAGENGGLCEIHVGLLRRRPPAVAAAEAGRRCTARTLHGHRCKNWAMRGRQPPLCRAHAYPRWRHGFYATSRSPAEVALAEIAAREGDPLAGEIAVLRLRVRAVLAYLERPGLTQAQRLGAYKALLHGVRLVGRLLRQSERGP